MRIKGLDAEAEAVNAAGNAGIQLIRRQVIDAAFKGYLTIIRQACYAVNFVQQRAYLRRIKHGRRTAAKEYRFRSLLGKNALLLQKIQLCQKRLHIFLNLLRLKGIAVKAAIRATQITERNMQIQRRRLRWLQSKLLQHRACHHPRQRFGLARNIGQILESCFHSSCPRLAGKSLIIIALIKRLNIFCIINHQPTPLLPQDTFLLPCSVLPEDIPTPD